MAKDKRGGQNKRKNTYIYMYVCTYLHILYMIECKETQHYALSIENNSVSFPYPCGYS